MERDSDVEPDIDMTAPGSETDQADGSAAQIPYEDLLEEHLTADVLDEGYSPPDYPPAVEVPTPAEELAGEGLAARLAEEEPETVDEEEDAGRESTAGVERSGRLTEPGDGDGRSDDVFADDAGIAGGAASAEEAAVHLLDDEYEE